VRAWRLPPQWTRPRTTAYLCVTARRLASAIHCCAHRCWRARLRRNNGQHIAHSRMFSSPIHGEPLGIAPGRPLAPERATSQGAGAAAHRSRRIRGDGPYRLGASCRRRTCRHRGQAAYPPTAADRAAHLPGDAGGLHAAKGMSNKEIAAALFLSPKTVEHHLSSVYRKRGSRAELATSFKTGPTLNA
jgi:hypothetical protein